MGKAAHIEGDGDEEEEPQAVLVGRVDLLGAVPGKGGGGGKGERGVLGKITVC